MKEKFLRRREPIIKLTLVSIWYRGRTNSYFVKGVVGDDGRCRVPEEIMKVLTTDIRRGETFSMF